MALRAPNGAALRAGELQGALERGHGWEGPAAEGLAAVLVACGFTGSGFQFAPAVAEHLADLVSGPLQWKFQKTIA